MKEKDFGIESSKSKETLRGLKKLAAVGSIAAAAFSLSACEDTANAEHFPEVTVSDEATPDTSNSQSGQSGLGESGETTSPEGGEAEYTVEELEIEAGLSDEELGRTLMQRLEAWENAEAPEDDNAELYQRGMKVGRDQAIEDLAEQNKQIFTDALMTDGWEDSVAASDFVDYMKQRNKKTIEGANASVGAKEPIPVDTYTYRSAETLENWKPELPVEGISYDRVLQVEYTWENLKLDGSATDVRAIFVLNTEGDQERIVQVRIIDAATNNILAG